MSIDGWECVELYAGHPWRARVAIKGKVEWMADETGMRVEESSNGYLGASGTYALSANVTMWIIQAVR